jgi:hypothetical protein
MFKVVRRVPCCRLCCTLTIPFRNGRARQTSDAQRHLVRSSLLPLQRWPLWDYDTFAPVMLRCCTSDNSALASSHNNALLAQHLLNVCWYSPLSQFSAEWSPLSFRSRPSWILCLVSWGKRKRCFFKYYLKLNVLISTIFITKKNDRPSATSTKNLA